jgi:hypothetical protein
MKEGKRFDMTRTTKPIGRRSATGPRRTSALLVLALAVCPTACVFTRPESTGLSVTITAPIAIPSGQAHTVLQGGQLAYASNRLAPWCELEVRTLAGAEPTIIKGGDFKVSRITSRLLLDPTTRIPALFAGTSCMGPLFQEGVWWLASNEPSDVMYLRCIAPYYECTFGPPLGPAQVQQQVGRYLTVREEAPVGERR